MRPLSFGSFSSAVMKRLISACHASRVPLLNVYRIKKCFMLLNLRCRLFAAKSRGVALGEFAQAHRSPPEQRLGIRKDRAFLAVAALGIQLHQPVGEVG